MPSLHPMFCHSQDLEPAAWGGGRFPVQVRFTPAQPSGRMLVLKEALLSEVLRYRTPSTRFDLLLRGKPLDRLLALFSSHGLPFSGAGAFGRQSQLDLVEGGPIPPDLTPVPLPPSMPPLPTEIHPGAVVDVGAPTLPPQPPHTPPHTPPQPPHPPRTPFVAGRRGAVAPPQHKPAISLLTATSQPQPPLLQPVEDVDDERLRQLGFHSPKLPPV